MLYTKTEIDRVLEDSGLMTVLTPAVLREVKKKYNEEHRHYHDFDHAVSVLSWVNQCCYKYSQDSLYPYTHLTLKLAALFHDVVYDQEGSPSNEERSAQLMLELVNPLGKLSNDTLQRTSELILATAKHGKLESADVPLAQALLLDCDIANFGEPRWEVFLWNNQNVVEELKLKYTPEEIEVGRQAFLGGMLAKKSIYLSPYFQSRFEQQARENLQRILSK